jgi:hypothetical protein
VEIAVEPPLHTPNAFWQPALQWLDSKYTFDCGNERSVTRTENARSLTYDAPDGSVSLEAYDCLGEWKTGTRTFALLGQAHSSSTCLTMGNAAIVRCKSCATPTGACKCK